MSNRKRTIFNLVETGLLKLTRRGSTEQPVLLSLQASGSLLGEEAIGAGRQYFTTASVRERACVLRLERHTFLQQVLVNPAVSQQLVQHLLLRQQFLWQVMDGLSHHSLRYRLLWHLEQLCLDLSPDEAGVWTISLTQAEVAQLVGGRREAVSLLLNELERAGWLGLARGKVLITAPEQLSVARQNQPHQAKTDLSHTIVH